MPVIIKDRSFTSQLPLPFPSVKSGGLRWSIRLPFTLRFGLGSVRASYPYLQNGSFCLKVSSSFVWCPSLQLPVTGSTVHSLSMPNKANKVGMETLFYNAIYPWQSKGWVLMLPALSIAIDLPLKILVREDAEKKTWAGQSVFSICQIARHQHDSPYALRVVLFRIAYLRPLGHWRVSGTLDGFSRRMATLIKNIHIGNTSGAHRMNPMLSKSTTPKP